MDITTLVSVYGKATFKECEICKGSGCEKCGGFGFYSPTTQPNLRYGIAYPLYIDQKKRDQVDFIRNSILLSSTSLLILSIIFSYIINIIYHAG